MSYDLKLTSHKKLFDDVQIIISSET